MVGIGDALMRTELAMAKDVTLKDGTRLAIRPIGMDDIPASQAFFKALPQVDRIYLRADVTRSEVIERRMQAIEFGQLRCVVAVDDGRIVADGALELEAREWKTHLAEIRLFVARDYQRKGLGALMARELYSLALESKVEEIMVRMMRPEKAAQSIFRRLGFRQDAVLTDYVRDMDGVKQDLIVMRCDLEALWQEMEDYLSDSDWQRTR
jgi:L-amino acid N-acyltransferase YncA